MRLIMALFILSLLPGCTSIPKFDTATPEGAYALAEFYEKDERFEDAIAQFESMRNKHPYHSLATEAKLRVADIYFKREDFPEAQASYQAFKEMHPSHPRSDYVTFQIGMSIAKQLPPTIDRDLGLANSAMMYFDETISSYASSPLSAKARDEKQRILRMLADKENYIAHFYFKRKMFESALGRFEDLIKKYPGSDLERQALYGAVVSAYHAKELDKAQSYMKLLESKYSGSEDAKKAQEVLDEK